MLSKLLITLLVISLAVIYLRRRKQASAVSVKTDKSGKVTAFLAHASSNGWQRDGKDSQSTLQSGNPATMAGKLRMILWIALAGLILLGSAYSVWHWQDQRRELTVLLYSSGEQAPVVYRVPRKDLGERSFTTSDGTRVNVSDSERMEIIGL
tara:strand:- start:44722 stop:45177 length:456 start_codon:yes stop_codon:yes gene_type:complete